MKTEENYIERHRFWSEVAIYQLSFTNNFLLTISTGMLAFCFDKKQFHSLQICLCCCQIDWELTFSLLSQGCLFIAIFFGIIVILSRLNDSRFTRQITLLRLRAFRDGERKLSHEECGEPDFFEKLSIILKLLFGKISYKKDKNLKIDFEDIRKLSHNLGSISWQFTMLQALTFFVAVIAYVISLLKS